MARPVPFPRSRRSAPFSAAFSDGLARAIKFLAGISKRGSTATPHLSGMKRKTANIDIRVEPQLVEKIDAWRARQRVPPSRSAAIVYMLEEFLEHDPVSRADWQMLLRWA